LPPGSPALEDRRVGGALPERKPMASLSHYGKDKDLFRILFRDADDRVFAVAPPPHVAIGCR